MNSDFLDNMHTVLCYIRFLQYAEEAGVAGVFDVNSLKNGLIKQVQYSITKNTDIWETSYV